jgi:putative membrane protein
MVVTAMVAAAVAIAPAVAFAQSTPAPAEKRAERAADKGKMASGDRKFVMEALKGGMAEVELGKLATEKASNDAVKQFGQRMVDDHGKAGDELKKLAQDKGIDTPAALDGKHQKLRDRLAKLSGHEFDRAYVDEMVKDHRKDVKEFQREAGKAKDPDVKSFASKTLPTLQDHLKQIESLQTQVKTAAKAEKK